MSQIHLKTTGRQFKVYIINLKIHIDLRSVKVRMYSYELFVQYLQNLTLERPIIGLNITKASEY